MLEPLKATYVGSVSIVMIGTDACNTRAGKREVKESLFARAALAKKDLRRYLEKSRARSFPYE